MPDTRRGYAYNKTRHSFLATEVRVADSHWSRLWGLIGTKPADFRCGHGLWIVPCHGVHTIGMRFSLDVIYLDASNVVVHLEENLRPWHIAPMKMEAATVLELPAHTVWQSNTKVGDSIEWNFGARPAKGPAQEEREIPWTWAG